MVYRLGQRHYDKPGRMQRSETGWLRRGGVMRWSSTPDVVDSENGGSDDACRPNQIVGVAALLGKNSTFLRESSWGKFTAAFPTVPATTGSIRGSREYPGPAILVFCHLHFYRKEMRLWQDPPGSMLQHGQESRNKQCDSGKQESNVHMDLCAVNDDISLFFSDGPGPPGQKRTGTL